MCYQTSARSSCAARIGLPRRRPNTVIAKALNLANPPCFMAKQSTQETLLGGRAHVACSHVPGNSRLSTALATRRLSFTSGALSTPALLAGVLAVGGVALAAASMGGTNGPSSNPNRSSGSSDPRVLTRSGMDKFRAGDVEGSLVDFDAVIQVAPHMRPYMWQRGLSLYYAGRFQEAAQQFREDVAVNPNDTEESIWAFLAEAQLWGPERARGQMLQVGRDPRPVMRAAYDCFQSGEQPDKIMAQATDNGGHATFYGLLYVGLWHESHGNAEEAKRAITAAVQTPYARLSGDYMAGLARVHCGRRGWAAE
ncbi:hypothetical protein Agub_g8608 [Astrephomene gubernaculifera]|uniref:Tetratricopeptide repeat protein n=1 Tax=Astrephomene gubernaculifera TaxID=47775 RepID=A0AAD3DUP6_9CHLO|nr:hypothetical protein Agub_g8608 [Astrephomene gubernaculifera]